mgnify:CR=1 FL=1
MWTKQIWDKNIAFSLLENGKKAWTVNEHAQACYVFVETWGLCFLKNM